MSEGFTLTRFANNFETFTGFGNTYGPLGIGFTQSGVLVTVASGKMYFFASDADNQNAATDATVTTNYGVFNALGMATSGNTTYLATHFNHSVIHINPNGTPAGGPAVADDAFLLASARDIVVNPANGHLFVSSAQGIFEIDPVLNTFTTFLLTGQTDGLRIIADGSILYAADFGSIKGYRTSDKVQVYNSGSIAGMDGSAIGTGSLAGKIYGNTNFGQLWEIDITNPGGILTNLPARTLIAENLDFTSYRGDLIKVDPNNGTLLITQTSEIYRLAPPTGGGFVGGANAAVPEPASLALWGIGALAIGIFHRRHQRSA